MSSPFITMLNENWALWEKTVNPIGDAILTWARPEGFPKSPAELGNFPVQSFNVALGIACAYLLFVFLGSIVMQPLEPFIKVLYPYKFVYNIIQVMLCSYMCIEAGLQAFVNGYSIVPCNPFDAVNPPVGRVLYIFYLSKILDFADTVFIILGKKWKQLSFLHVYHHTSIFLFYWLNLHVGFDGDIYLTIVLNGLIHTIMYTYYFVSMHTDNIWWKQFLTLAQMVQFVLMNAQALWLMYFQCSEFPRNLVLAYLYYIITMLVLFMMFYIKSYSPKPATLKLLDPNQPNGKNIEVRVEKGEAELVKELAGVSHAVCVGEGKSYLCVVLSLKTERGSDSTLAKSAIAAVSGSTATTVAEACTDEAWMGYLNAGKDKVNKGRTSDVGKIVKILVASAGFSEAAGTLKNGKAVRGEVLKAYEKEIKAMYSD